ncbi:2-thiouracil desulfurase family protein [Thiolapillus brandeum]|uniref:DUF523 domain-containing protein n=1 Tax=Thiolapillus brandeum TaxID=1076588 RepID=A0A7U6GKI6_9GAMM|nr:DUF523 domain-containing protein [Thiolapillus brandeum]BAO45282.1 conserved hypothetical protein [Thiolapillus brandeum]
MKPLVGVSACLLGDVVRYDGDSRPHAWVRDELSRYARIVPICPETEAGLGVPRPPVQLVLQGKEVHALGVEDSRLDVTPALSAWMREQMDRLQRLDALILKSRSPSCGLGNTPLFDLDNVELRANHDGLFAGWVRRLFPDLLLCDEVLLEEKPQQAAFLSRLAKKSG